MARPALHEHRRAGRRRRLLLPLLLAAAGAAGAAPPPLRGGPCQGRRVAYRHRAEGLGAAEEELGAGGCGRPGVAAVASFNGCTAADGWGRLSVTTCAGFDAREQMFGAGYVEGFVTGLQMELYWANYAAAEYPAGAPPAALRSWMAAQLDWAREQVDEHAESEPRWAAMGLILAHYDGLVAGYNQSSLQRGGADDGGSAAGRAGPLLDPLTIYMLGSVGDLEELNGMFGGGLRGAGSAPREEVDRLMDCSALVKVTEGDLQAAHATWRSYYAMLRTWKRYDFTSALGRRLSVASSPGLLHSKDDFYAVVGDGGVRLVVMETTNSVFNQTHLEEHVHPESLLSWQRASLANYLAQGPFEWTQLFTRHNSGTYNNQWMVIDMAAERPATGAWRDVLWIAEQAPGLVLAQDVSEVLQEQGYWASYNIPYASGVYEWMGYPQRREAVRKAGGDWEQYDYSKCARAQIFARDHAKDIFEVMRYNRWEDDPLSKGSPLNAVASRGDLVPAPRPGSRRGEVPVAFGAVDAKVTSARMLERGEVRAVCGPTTDGQPAFSWADPRWANVSHAGVPERFDFDWVVFDLPS